MKFAVFLPFSEPAIVSPLGQLKLILTNYIDDKFSIYNRTFVLIFIASLLNLVWIQNFSFS